MESLLRLAGLTLLAKNIVHFLQMYLFQRSGFPVTEIPPFVSIAIEDLMY